jgi:hypothetical protein
MSYGTGKHPEISNDQTAAIVRALTAGGLERTRPSYTPEEVSGVLKLHPVYCRRLFTRGMIPGAVRIGRVWRLPADALDRILATGLNTSGGAR